MISQRAVFLGVLMLMASAGVVSAQDTASGQQLNLDPVRTPAAYYPGAAVEKGIKGPVKLHIHVNEKGEVERPTVVSGDPLLAEPALRVMKYWRFKPPMQDGKPATADGIVSVEFQPRPPFVRVSSSVITAMLVRKVEPDYPAEISGKRVPATVIVQILIAIDGTVQEATPVSGPKEFYDAAVKAAREWQYKPYVFEGEPIPVRSELQFNFQ